MRVILAYLQSSTLVSCSTSLQVLVVVVVKFKPARKYLQSLYQTSPQVPAVVIPNQPASTCSRYTKPAGKYLQSLYQTSPQVPAIITIIPSVTMREEPLHDACCGHHHRATDLGAYQSLYLYCIEIKDQPLYLILHSNNKKWYRARQVTATLNTSAEVWKATADVHAHHLMRCKRSVSNPRIE